MALYYSQSSQGFFDPLIHDFIPDDSVEITMQQHKDLFIGQSNGKIIVSDVDGFPVLVDPPSPDISQIRNTTKCTSWQLRRALTQMGLRDSVETAVASADQDIKDMWEYATTYERMHPFVIAISTQLNKTPEEVDELFAVAISIL